MSGDSYSSTSLRLLHLEDSVADAELVYAILSEEWPGCRIERVQTRPDYLAALQREEGFDLILSDFSMPSFDGLSALDLARERRPEIPYIFLSGTIGEHNAVEALKKGAIDYVIKDRMGRLVPAIRRALAEKIEQEQRRVMEQRLRESQERFQQLAEQSSEIFWFTALNPERILYIGPAIERIWGRPAAEFYSEPRAWLASLHPGDRERVETAYEACLQGRAPHYEEEYRVVRPDGSERWVIDTGTIIRDATGAAIRLSGIAKDITERKATEHRLREQADLLDKARDAICVVDTDGRITYWNQSAERLFGWKQAEACGRTLTELLFRGDRAVYLRARHAMLDDDAWSSELQIKTRDGQALVVESRWTLVRGADGLPQAILLLNTDVTEQKRMEKDFLRAQRLESVGMLAGGIAHDLNNVLAPILMSVHLLQQKSGDESMRRLLGVLETSAQHGAGLIRQVLAFSRGVEGERLNLQPQVVIGDVARLVAEILPRSITIKTNSPRETWFVHSNSTQLSQVLMNLCVNARDAMPEGGSLTICAQNIQVDEAKAAAHPGTKAGPHVLITVSDTGSGIPPEIVDRIFDPFFSTKTVGKGTGLGLSTVLGIVKSHGGFLEVQSEVGHGTAFNLYFPAVGAAPKATETRNGPAAAPGAGETILVIDDEEAVRAVISAILEAHGYRSLLAADGAAGIELYRQHPGEVAAVLTDMMMPAMQGAEVIRRIRALNPSAGIVVMSGLLGEQEGLPEDRSGIAFLQKPMTGAALVKSVQQVMAGGAKAA